MHSASVNAELGKKGFQRTHGGNDTKEYKSWAKMLARCYNPNSTRYCDWGGRGIEVCVQWRHDFAQFLKDMGPKPTPKHQLERIDNDGNYEPGNCKWATVAEQARNRKSTILLTFNGKTQCAKDWAAEMGFPPMLVQKRIRDGWSVERALTEPVRKRR